MGILDRMEQRQRIENPSVPLTSSNLVAALGLGDSTPAGVTVNQSRALGITAFWNGVRIISQTIASLPLEVFERMEPRGRELARQHQVHQLLHVRPNPHMTPFTFKETRAAHVLTWGNSFAEIERDRANRPIALWPLLPDRTGVEVRSGEKFYWTIVNGVKVFLSADRVLHVPGLGFDGLQGYNVVKVHRDSLGLSIAANEYGAQFFGNSGRPSGYLEHPGKPGVDERQQFREEWNQVHTGLTKAQRTAVLWGGMKWSQVSINPEEAQFLETRSMQIDEVARILNINPILLQKTEGATTWGTAIGQFLVAFAKFTIQPWLEREEDAINWDLFGDSERGRLFVKYNMNALLRGDSKTQAEVLEIKRRNAVINADEWRELDDQNPLPDGIGSIYTIPLNFQDISLFGQDEPAPTGESATRQRGVEQRQRRSLAARQRLQEAHLSAFEDGARRFVRRDVQSAQAAIKRAFDQGGDPAVALNRWIDEFYPDQRRVIMRTMLPLVSALASLTAAEAAEEVGADPQDIAVFAQSYTENLAVRETGSSAGQIRSLIQETNQEELQAALLLRTEEWTQTRPAKVAANEVVRVASGAARFAYEASGVTYMTWRANANACPICMDMDGRRVPISGMFLSAGDTVNPGDGVAPLTTETNIAGPPLHQGCTCSLVPG